MPNLLDNWTLDRSPGAGKVINSSSPGTSTGTPNSPGGNVGGIVGVGATGTVPANWAALPEPGVAIPPKGSTERVNFLLAMKKACAFNGSTMLRALPHPASTTMAFSFSGWFNFATDLSFGFVPSQAQGQIFGSNNASQAGEISSGYHMIQIMPNRLFIDGGGLNGSVITYPQYAPGSAGIEWPSAAQGDFSAGWRHLMVSVAPSYAPPTDGSNMVQGRAVIWVNDTQIYDGVFAWIWDINSTHVLHGLGVADSAAGDGSFYCNQFWGSAIQNTSLDTLSWPNLGFDPTDGNGLKCAVAEFMLYENVFIDWNTYNNRYHFQINDNANIPSNLATYAPCDVGPTGARPTGTKPTVYLSGLSSQFKLNRAASSAALTVYGGLVDVTVPIT